MSKHWFSQGLCHQECIDGTQPNPWFVDLDENDPMSIAMNDYAKSICMQCPVREECLEFGFDEEYGRWGGFDPMERLAMGASIG